MMKTLEELAAEIFSEDWPGHWQAADLTDGETMLRLSMKDIHTTMATFARIAILEMLNEWSDERIEAMYEDDLEGYVKAARKAGAKLLILGLLKQLGK